MKMTIVTIIPENDHCHNNNHLKHQHRNKVGVITKDVTFPWH